MIERIEPGQLAAARRAPSGPQVHDDHLALEVRQRESTAIEPLEGVGSERARRSLAAHAQTGVRLRGMRRERRGHEKTRGE